MKCSPNGQLPLQSLLGQGGKYMEADEEAEWMNGLTQHFLFEPLGVWVTDTRPGVKHGGFHTTVEGLSRF